MLYRQAPESRTIRSYLLMLVFGMPWLMVPLVAPGPAAYATCLLGVLFAVPLGLVVDRAFRRRLDTAIHEHGASIRIGGERELLWFTNDTFVTEIHEIMRAYGEPDEDQWVFEVKTPERTLALSTYVPGSASRIREALTRAVGREPRLVQRR